MNEWNASSSTRVPGHPSRVIASIASPLARRTPAGSRVRGSTAPSTSSPSGSRLGRCEWRSPRAWRRSFAPSHARVNSRHRPIRRGVRGRRRAIRGRCGDDARREVPLETFAGRAASRWSPSSPSSLSHDPSIAAAPAHRVAMRWPSTRRRRAPRGPPGGPGPPPPPGAGAPAGPGAGRRAPADAGGARDDARGRARARARARATRQGARARRGEGRRRGRGRAPRAGARGR